MNMKQNAALEMFEYLKEHLIPLAKDKGDKVYESDTTVQIARPENKSVWDCEKEVKQLLSKIGAYSASVKNSIAKEKGFTVIETKVGDGDHIHVFVSVPPKFSITTIVSYLKGITGRHLFMAFPEIKQKLWKGHLWNDSYFVESIGSTSSENIIHYIERQSNHCM